MKRETVTLYSIAGILCLLVAVFSVLTTPDLSPATLVYHDDSYRGTTVTSTKSTESSAVAAIESSAATGSFAVTASANASPAVSGKVNINTATKEELMTLSGIGEVLAERILAYRNQYNGFDSLEELMEVSGIGEKRFAAIQADITL